MKITLLVSLLISYGFGYKVGDTVSASVKEKLTLEEDKVYVINFFASWCKSCKHELPLINKVSKEIRLIGINIDRNRHDGEAFVNQLGLNFKIVYDDESIIVKEFNPIGVPAIYFIKDGQVVAKKIGAVDEVDTYILTTLEELK